MKKVNKFFVVCITTIFLVLTIISCKNVNKYQVSFNTDNGDSTLVVEVNENGLVPKPSDPINDGYKFVGWYKDSEYQQEFDFNNDRITSNITIYAKWDIYSVDELLKLNIPDYEMTKENFIVKTNVVDIENPNFGSMHIKDSTGEIYVFDTKDSNGIKYKEMLDRPYQNDEVLLKGKVKNFAGTKEIHEGIILEFDHIYPEFDDSEYAEMSILEARNAKKNQKVKVSGQVAQITYANGLIPSGFLLVDNKSSIYVYDAQVAARVKVGRTLTICATKDYYVLETEATAAKKYGYKGSNQLKDVHLVEISDTSSNVNLDFAQETTIKNIIDLDNTLDFTNVVYKVNALIKRVPDMDFVNYYFYDIDGVTGSYTYTQASGADFAWLDQYVGKICTVYLVVQNAKCLSSGVTKRFLPIFVSYDDYQFDLKDTPKYVLDYLIDGQFEEKYAADPNQKVLVSTSSELLGFKDVNISYKSNSKAISFVDDIMHIDINYKGIVTITVTVKYKEYEASRDYQIEVVDLADYNPLSISEVLNGEFNKDVTLRGIVTSALVNQKGFYLSDSTGIIAVRIDQDTLNSLKLGDEVIIKGKYLEKGKIDAEGNQIHIDEAKILFNLHGNNNYDNSSFKESSIEELSKLDMTGLITAKGYKVKAKLVLPEGSAFAPYQLESNGFAINLYQGSKTQHDWIKPYLNQELEYEVAICNWNGKYNQLCIISVKTKTGEVILNPLV